MKRIFILLVVITLAALSITAFAQRSKEAEVLYHRGVQLEEVKGELKEAIAVYEKLIKEFVDVRTIAAQALLRIGNCYEKLGQNESKAAYQRIIRDFGDQAEIVAEARVRLAALTGAAGATGGSTMAVRRVWATPKGDSSISMGQVSPDGRFVTFTDWSTGDLAIHELATGQDRHLTNNGPYGTSDEFTEFSVPSPDSRQVAYNWYNSDGSYDLRILGLDGSKPRVLRAAGNGVSDLFPLAWSPDGRHLFTEFIKTDGTYDMMLVTVADGSTKLLKTMGADPSPGGVFSPDGRYIAWAVKDGISLVELQTGKEYPLVPDLAPHHVLGWSPDGRYILFSSERSGSADMWLVAVADGKAEGEPELVKKGYSGYALGFTRAGAFYYCLSNIAREVHIAEWDPASGSLVTPLQPVSRRWSDVSRNPDWSPDGRFLAYVRSPASNDSFIVIRSTKTGEERELSVGKMRIGFSLRWTSDGNAVVVSASESGKGWGLMRVDVQTGQATSLMPIPHYGALPRFDLSPDGRTIFYVKHSPPPNMNQTQLVARDLQSAHETEIIQKSGLNWVSVSPDGKRLAIGVQEDRSLVLRVLPVTGGEAHEVVRIDADEANYRVWTSWTPDGRYLIFARGQKGRATRNVQVWRIAAEGGEPQRLALTVDELWWLRLHPDGRHVAIGTWKTSSEAWVMENFLPPPKVIK